MMESSFCFLKFLLGYFNYNNKNEIRVMSYFKRRFERKSYIYLIIISGFCIWFWIWFFIVLFIM